MSDTIGRVTIPDPQDSGLTFPLTSEFGYATSRSRPVVIHRFGELATVGEQRFKTGFGPRKFVFRRTDLTAAEVDDLYNFYEDTFGCLKLFNYLHPDSAQTLTSYKVFFDEAPLSAQHLVAAVQVGITFIEYPDPNTAPTYSISATEIGLPSPSFAAALLEQVQEIIPLIKITPRDSGIPVVYLADRRCTVAGNLYLPRIVNIGERGSDALITQQISGAADNVNFTCGNGDRSMTKLANDCDLRYADIEFCLYHVNTSTLYQLWKGYVISFGHDGSNTFQLQCSDALFQVNQLYPKRTISRQDCWKTFNDGLHCPYATVGSGGDPTQCDYTFDGPLGCQSHHMDDYYGAHPAQPQGVQVKDNTTGVWGFGRNIVTATSIISDTMWNKVLAEIWCNDDGNAGKCLQVDATMVAVRDEGDFIDTFGIVGAGKIGEFTGMQVYTNSDGYQYVISPTADGFLPHGFKVDNQFKVTHDPQSGLRERPGDDPAVSSSDYFSLTQGAFGGGTNRPPIAAGTAFVELRYAKPSGFAPTAADTHSMQVPISQGLSGFVWDASGNRTLVPGLTNPFWIIINSYLRAIGKDDADSATQLQYFDLPSLNDGAGNGCAEIADLVVPPMFGTGDETQFRFQGLLAQQKPFRDWLNEIQACALGFFIFEFGKLKLGIRENASAISAFTRGNIVLQSNYSELSVSPVDPQFERLVIEYADRDYQFQTNTAKYYDKDHARYFNRQNAPLETKQHSLGCASQSQAARLATVRCREEIGGIDSSEWMAARVIAFKSTVLAVGVTAGSVISITHPDVPGGFGHFRILKWSLLKDWSVLLEVRSVTVSMYDVVFGPKPADVAPLPLPALFYPEQQGEWAPYQVHLPNDDQLFPGEWTFDVALQYIKLADDSTKALANITGKLPVDHFIPGCGPPRITSGSVSRLTAGGFLLGGKTYRMAVCATQLDANGRLIFSPPSATIIVQIPTGSDNNAVIIDGIIWPDFAGLTGWVLFASDKDDLICFAQDGSLTNVGSNVYSPALTTLIGPLTRSTYALPNPNVNKVRLKQKVCTHAGVLGAPITDISGDTFTAPQTIDLTGVDNWVGRYATIIGRPSGDLPPVNFKVLDFNPTTGLFTVDRDVAATGVLVDDVIVVTFLGYDNSATPRTLTDAGISNALNYDVDTGDSTPHSGLKSDQDKGKAVLVIAGPNRGAQAMIITNDALSYTLDRDFVITELDVWVVVARSWDSFVDSSVFDNPTAESQTTINVPIDNFLQQTILIGGFTVDKKGIESLEPDAPYRIAYVYGNPFLGIFEKATFNIQFTALTVGTDVAFHYLVKRAGKLSDNFPVSVHLKDPPTGSDAIIDLKYTPPGEVIGGPSTVSIFSDPAKITIPDGVTDLLQITGFDSSIQLEERGIITCDVIQVGSTTPGARASIAFLFKVDNP